MKRLILLVMILVLLLAPIQSMGATTAALVPNPKFTSMDSNGDPRVGAKLYTYETGTTTPKTTWTSSTKGASNTNPIILDSNGEADVWIDSTDGAYRFKLTDSNDVTLWTKDGIKSSDRIEMVDDDGDTKIQVEESTDDDTIRFDCAGVNNVLTLTASAISGSLVKDEDTMVSDSPYHVATQQSIKAYADSVEAAANTYTDTEITATEVYADAADTALQSTILGSYPGLVIRGRFSWKDGDEIYIDPAVYDHQGTTTQLIKWDSQLSYMFGSSGSNSSSSDLASADTWVYVYLDDSAIVTLGSNIITAAEILAVTEAPVWSASKHGWYGSAAAGNAVAADRCIFAVLLDSAGTAILEFYGEGDEIIFADEITSRVPSDLDDTWMDVTLSIPSFCTRGKVLFWGGAIATSSGEPTGYWRTNGQAGSTGHRIYKLNGNYSVFGSVSCTVTTDSSGVIEVYHDVAGTQEMGVFTSGWYFPGGM